MVEMIIIAIAFAAVVVPIGLAVIVRRRQKRNSWSGGFTPAYRKWTLDE